MVIVCKWKKSFDLHYLCLFNILKHCLKLLPFNMINVFGEFTALGFLIVNTKGIFHLLTDHAYFPTIST